MILPGPTLISQFSNFDHEEGDVIVVFRNSNSHNYPIDKPLIISRKTQAEYATNIIKGMKGNNLRASDCYYLS